MKKHFVRFYSPGTFIAEMTEKPIDTWDVDKAKEIAYGVIERHRATPYGFRFITRERKKDELDSKETKKSGMYYLGGIVQTLEQVIQKNDPKNNILIQNMKCNNWDKILFNNNSWSWCAPLEKDDVVLEFTKKRK